MVSVTVSAKGDGGYCRRPWWEFEDAGGGGRIVGGGGGDCAAVVVVVVGTAAAAAELMSGEPCDWNGAHRVRRKQQHQQRRRVWSAGR